MPLVRILKALIVVPVNLDLLRMAKFAAVRLKGNTKEFEIVDAEESSSALPLPSPLPTSRLLCPRPDYPRLLLLLSPNSIF